MQRLAGADRAVNVQASSMGQPAFGSAAARPHSSSGSLSTSGKYSGMYSSALTPASRSRRCAGSVMRSEASRPSMRSVGARCSSVRASPSVTLRPYLRVHGRWRQRAVLGCQETRQGAVASSLDASMQAGNLLPRPPLTAGKHSQVPPTSTRASGARAWAAAFLCACPSRPRAAPAARRRRGRAGTWRSGHGRREEAGCDELQEQGFRFALRAPVQACP